MPAPLRVGLAGTGDIGRIHARALKTIPGTELVLAKGRNGQRAEALGEALDAPVAESFEALLSDASVDAVIVCVPNDLHAQYTIAALEAGKAVLCEKPMAMSIADAEAMRDAAARARQPLMVGHVLRFWPEYAQGRKLLQAGVLGRVHSLSARRLVPLLRAVRGEDGWRHAGNRSGGAVVDLLVHDVDFVIWTFGMPARVTSRGVRTGTGAFEHAFTLLEYADGPLVQLESSYMLQGNPVTMDYRAIGEAGSLEFAFQEASFAMHDIGDSEEKQHASHPSLIRYRWEQPREVLAEQPEDVIGDIFRYQMEGFLALARGEAVEVPQPQEAINALRVVLAARESCETGQSVAIT